MAVIMNRKPQKWCSYGLAMQRVTRRCKCLQLRTQALSSFWLSIKYVTLILFFRKRQGGVQRAVDYRYIL